MITLICILIVWGVISAIRIHLHCKKKGISFDPFTRTFSDWMGFWIGGIIFLTSLAVAIIKYLP